MITIGNVIGSNLRQLRVAKNWTQEQAAAHVAAKGLDWKRTQIADLETGRRETVDVGALVVLASAFDVTVTHLLAADADVLVAPVSQDEWSVAIGGQQLRLAMVGQEFSLKPIGNPPVPPCSCCAGSPPPGFTCNQCSATA